MKHIVQATILHHHRFSRNKNILPSSFLEIYYLNKNNCKLRNSNNIHFRQIMTTTNHCEENKAIMLTTADADLERAGEMLRQGNLVAFPTETVYGLGANALDEKAVLKIFEAKARPLTDPLIVHVPNTERALELLEVPEESKPIYEYLATSFWPGPLTLVGKAHTSIPLTVTAGTGMVGLRIPNHPIAKKLLEVANVPVAAPSANRFGHVSPTSANHVYTDLGIHPYIAIVDGGTCKTNEKGDCNVGIESTVMKVDHERKKLVLFRRGGISEQALKEAMNTYTSNNNNNNIFLGYEIEVIAKVVIHKENMEDNNNVEQDKDDGAAIHGEEAPGQHLKHYAPDVPATLVEIVDSSSNNNNNNNNDDDDSITPLESMDLSTSVILDFNSNLLWLKDKCLEYRDLSLKGDMSEVAASLFSSLRWSETVEGATNVYVVEINDQLNEHEHRDAVKDKLFRAASGRKIKIVKVDM